MDKSRQKCRAAAAYRSAPGDAAPQCVTRRAYDRRVELARVLPLWPHEIEDETAAGRTRIIVKLRRALRAERRRGIAGHWTYDLGRHMELLRLYRLELASWRSFGTDPYGRSRPDRT